MKNEITATSHLPAIDSSETFIRQLLVIDAVVFTVENVLATVVSPAGLHFADKMDFETVKTLKNGYLVKRLTLTDNDYR
jgi:hypothetical protein